jgi:HK97 family phage major capsid protein
MVGSERKSRRNAGDDDESLHEHDVRVGKDSLAYDKKGGYNHAGEFFADVTRNRTGSTPNKLDSWQKATLSTYGSEGVGVDGGFAVPPEFRAQIMQHVDGESSLMSMCDQYPLSGNGITFPTDESTPWESSGSVRGYWDGEATAPTQSKPKLRQTDLKLRKITALVPLTDELLEDAPAMNAFVTRKAGEVLDFKVGEAIIRGNGVSQPLGILTHTASLVSVAKETSQANDTVLAMNIFKMWSRMYGPWRTNDAAWLVNQDVEPQLFSMTVPVKNVAGTENVGGSVVYVPSGTISGQPYSTLMGHRVIPTQHCNTVGDQGDILFVNLKKYALALKSSGLQAATSMHVFFDQGVTALRFQLRVDGKPWLGSTIAARSGSNTMSAFVTLDAR